MAALPSALRCPRPSPTMPRCKARWKHCAPPSRSNARSSKPRPNCSKRSRHSSRRSPSSSASRRSPRRNRRRLPLQEAPKLTFTNNRPTITAADGTLLDRGSRQRAARRRAVRRSRRKVRSTTDFRRGSVGATAQPGKQRRARLQRRLLFPPRAFRRRRHHRARLQLPPAARTRRLAAPKVRRASTTPGSRTPASRRSPSSSAHSRRPPTWTTAPRPKTCCSSNAPALPSCRARWAAPMAASASGVKANGSRWMSAFTFTTRTVNDAEVFDRQLAAVGRAGGSSSPPASDYNVHLGASGTYVFSPADQGSGAHSAPSACASATGPRSASTACASSTPAPSTPSTPACYGMEFGAQLEEPLSAGRTLLVRRRAPRRRGAARSGLRGLLPAGQLDTHRREPPLQRGHRLVPESAAQGAVLAAKAASAPGSWRRATAA